MTFSPEFLDELRARTDLGGLVGRRMRLTKRGREFVGLCPFHNEKTPSFTVSPAKGFYHCFGCGAHGDGVGFVMQSEGLSFTEAVAKLAGEAGLALPLRTPEADEAEEHVHSCMVRMSTLEGDIRNARDKSTIPEVKIKLEATKKELPQLEETRDRFTQYYEVELDKRKATITHEGIEEAQKEAGIGSFYIGDNIDLPHLLEQSIRAHTVYQRDRDYVVAPDDRDQLSVIIVDQNTGRKMVGRQWSDGLHQAVEAKEGVPIKEETQTMATITIQNFFKLYGKLAGMTGTADTEATEFYEIYKLDVVVIPTNVPVVRGDHNDVVFIDERDKWVAIVDEIKAFHDVGRPILVGTTSVEKSEKLSQMLSQKYNVVHEVPAGPRRCVTTY